ncbi:colipase [Anolis carolinensis]|uniref:Colipase n=1 Tax=Anolis carolinensis TaxID=28377 RepID=H9GRD8_ANOCA|nr:PREDICTED: colipase [Anolis carolinensis]|eukprot:XP_003226535.1 PREDICTED: colipase [Anolis carolinensis]
MERAWVLLLFTCILAESFASPRGLIFNLDNGELCMQSLQCKSGCCHRTSGLSLARCSDKAAENQECSRKHIYGIYYRCPCESGLTCDADWTIVGGITNSDFGICKDPAKRK